MKKFFFMLFFFSSAIIIISAQTIPVTFSVNMGARVFNGIWDPSKDSIAVRGDFQADAGDVYDWSGFIFKMNRAAWWTQFTP